MRKLIILTILILGCKLVLAQSPFQAEIDNAKNGQIIESINALTAKEDANNLYFHAAIGEIYLLAGNNEKSQYHLNEVINSKANIDPKNTYALVQSYTNLGVLLWNQGKDNQALDQLFKALNLVNTNPNADKSLVAGIENNLGLIYSSTDPATAKKYYESALIKYQESAPQSDKTAQTTTNLGILSKGKGAYTEALSYFNAALEIMEGLYGKSHPTAAFILANIGQVYDAMNDQSLTKYYYTEALNIYLERYGKKHPEVANMYTLMGDYELNNNRYKQALALYQQALIANSLHFQNESIFSNPMRNEAIKPLNMLFTYVRKAVAFEKYYYGFSLRNEHLRQSVECVNLGDELISQLRASTVNKQDKLIISELAYELYEIGQRVALQLSKGTLKTNSFKSMAFYYAEKGKAATLLSAIADTEAKNFAGIPAELLEKEKSIKEQIVLQEVLFAKENDFDKAILIRSKLTDLQNEFERFQKEMERNYPAYYELKTNPSIVSVEALQTKLTPYEMVLSYSFHESKDQLYIYEITKRKLEIHVLNDAAQLKRLIRGYRNSIQFKLRNEFIAISSEIGSKLIPSRINSSIHHLFIIADGEIAKIPFESLLTAKVEEKEYTQLPYLINRFQVSYNFSAAFVIKQQTLNENNATLLVAPVDFYDVLSARGLSDLPGSEVELQQIGSIFENSNYKTTSLKHKAANKSEINKLNLSDYNYIHLATHGKVDENTPELSRLFLASAEGGTSAELYANEIYNWELNAHLLCLSACETGLGKLSRGEGIIGLSRAFTFAGASNVLVSLWTVSDQSTSLLMIDFYRLLMEPDADRSVLAGHLQQAKKQMISNTEFAAPYYWAPFVLIGK